MGEEKTKPEDAEFSGISPKLRNRPILIRKNSANSFNSVMTGMTGLTKVTGE